jgi:transcriptional regulator with XRE-family HTH domain
MRVPMNKIQGDILRERRKYLNSRYRQKELTLRDIAKKAHVGLGYVSEIEQGKKNVSEDILRAVLPFYELELYELLKETAVRMEVYENAGANS